MEDDPAPGQVRGEGRGGTGLRARNLDADQVLTLVSSEEPVIQGRLFGSVYCFVKRL